MPHDRSFPPMGDRSPTCGTWASAAAISGSSRRLGDCLARCTTSTEALARTRVTGPMMDRRSWR